MVKRSINSAISKDLAIKEPSNIAGKVKKGRPSSMNIKDIEPVIMECSKIGYTDAQICAKLGISRECYYNWQRNSKEFYDLTKRAKEISESYWSSLMQNNIMISKDKPRVDTIAWLFWMKNCFNWKDKTELSSDKDNPLTINLDVKASKV